MPSHSIVTFGILGGVGRLDLSRVAVVHTLVTFDVWTLNTLLKSVFLENVRTELRV